MVAWHGSALQRNFRERYAKIMEKIDAFGTDSLSDAERRFFENSGKLQSMQKEFFSRVGVNEYVTRLGQEPVNYKIAWTLSVPDMEKFGIFKVQAPAWYGRPSYCSEWLLATVTPVKCLKLTPEILEYAK
jgi:hypothetical protein